MIASLVLVAALGAPPVQIAKVKSYDHLRLIAVAPAPTGAMVAASLEDRSVRLFNAATGTSVRTLVGHPQPAYGLAFNPAGTLLATGDESGRIFLWDVKSGAKAREFTRVQAHIRGIQSLSFSSDGKRLVSTGKDDQLIVWEVPSGKILQRIAGNGANFFSAAYALAGQLIAPTLGDGIRVYRTADFSLAATMQAHENLGVNDLAFDKAKRLAISAGRNGLATLWWVKERAKVNSLRGHQDWVIKCALSPNGRVALTSSSDRTVIVWDTITFKAIAKLEDQSFVGSPVCFTADGKYFITANGSDGLQVNKILPPQL